MIINLKYDDEEILDRLDEGLGCIIFDFGCYFPYMQQKKLKFDFSLGEIECNDITLDHRYSSYNYVTISKDLGQVASKLGYPLFCELGKRNMLLKIHIGYKKDNINIIIPLEINLSKDKPTCALTFRMTDFSNLKFTFQSNYKSYKYWSGKTWSNCETRKLHNHIILDEPIQLAKDTLLYSNIITPFSQAPEELLI